MRRLVPVAALAVALVLHPTSVEPACPPVLTAPTPAEVQSAQRQARNRGVLWRFEKDGRHGYLYGTLHVGNLEWAIPGDLVRRALADADTIAIESDPTDPTFQAAMAAAAKPGEAPELSPAVIERLRQAAAKVCVPWTTIAKWPPMMIASTLVLITARHDGLYADYATEAVLAGVAKAAGKRLVALESAATQRAAGMMGTPPEQLAFIEATLTALESGTATVDLVAAARAWANGDLEALAESMARAASAARATLDRVVLGRNPALADGIAALHGEGRRVFAGVGTLHMVGDAGIPNLLIARGFTVQRIRFGAP